MSIARETNKAGAAPYTQREFGGGMVRNAPHEDIPVNSVANLINAHAHPTEIRPRLASWLRSEVQPPPIVADDCSGERDGITASKSGNVITATDDVFLEGDVSNYFYWPGTPPGHDEIIEYVSATQVRTANSSTHDSTAGCYIHGRLNLNKYHRLRRKAVYQWGRDNFIAPNTSPLSRTQAWCISRQRPSNTVSDWDEMDEYGIIGNSKGIFKLNFDREPPVLWKMNTPCPSVLVSDTVRTIDTKYRHDYIYSMSRLSGTGLRQRNNGSSVILQESGTNSLDTTQDPPRDYGIRWHPRKIDSGVRTQGRLVGGVMAAAQQSPDYWNVTVPFPGVSFSVTMNGRTESFLIDFGPAGYNVTSMGDVAAGIQSELRTVFEFATCEYHEDGYFIITSGEEDDSDLDYFTAGVGGTDVSALMMLTAATASSLDNSYAWAQPYVVGPLSVPVVDDEPGVREQHWTHYTIYRTTDIGPNGVTPRVSGTEDLPPLQFTWNRDLRISAAFYAYKTRGGHVYAEVGTFEPADVGATIEWEDGDVDTIIEYISPTHVRVAAGAGYYYDEAKPLQAVAIGGGRVIRASQTDDLVDIESLYNTLRFSCDDVRKTITWSTGVYSIIIEYISPTRVRVADSLPKSTQGITLDATERRFSDRERDANLRNRQDERHVGLLNHRFWVPLANANISRIVPGFLLTAQRTDTLIRYSQLEVSKKYLAGYHLELEQTLDKVEHPIYHILRAPNYFIVLCNASTWGGPTNNPDVKRLPEFGEEFAQLHVDVLDEAIGVTDWPSVQEVDFGVFEMRCADNAWRQLAGLTYGKDFTIHEVTGQDIIGRDLKLCWNLSDSCYTKVLGHIWWGTLR